MSVDSATQWQRQTVESETPSNENQRSECKKALILLAFLALPVFVAIVAAKKVILFFTFPRKRFTFYQQH